MADTKTTALAALATIAAEDLFFVIDDPAGTPVSKKATAAAVATYVTGTFFPTASSTNCFGPGSGRAANTGLESTTYGRNAGQSLTTAGAITAFGYLACAAVTTGEYNTGLGTHCLRVCTTGRYNTAVGTDALWALTTGNENTAVGKFALFNANGTNNVAVGVNALQNLTTGSNNVMVGSYAGNGVTTGGDNTVMGDKALQATGATAATRNCIFGQSAGNKATGNSNVLMGYLSGYNMTSGSNNVLIGPSNFVAASYDQVTTGSRNVSIGVETAVASATASNQLCISNFIYGTGMSGSGATISTGGKLGFGTKAPDYFVHVNGAFGIAPGASVTPANNGDVVFELTNNTTLTIKAKGSDGTVRSGTVALA